MKIIKRTLIFRECPGCKIGAFVRKDGAGKLCRKCRAIENSKIPHHKDILGLRFGKLLVTKFVGIWNSRSYYWNCICDCGKELWVHGNRLRSGKTKSCGCISRKAKGLSTTLMYRKWKSILFRCYNPKSISYKNYGARGIIVCDEWKNSFDAFHKDMGECPVDHTIDRIYPNGNYEPSNCKWSTYKEQALNRRKRKKK